MDLLIEVFTRRKVAAAKPLESKMTALIADCADEVNAAFDRGISYINTVQTGVNKLENLETQPNFHDFATLIGNRKACTYAMSAAHGPALDSLGAHASEVHALAFKNQPLYAYKKRRTRKRLMKHAQKELEVGLELRKRLGTDARQYIKSYKALLLS